MTKNNETKFPCLVYRVNNEFGSMYSAVDRVSCEQVYTSSNLSEVIWWCQDRLAQYLCESVRLGVPEPAAPTKVGSGINDKLRRIRAYRERSRLISSSRGFRS